MHVEQGLPYPTMDQTLHIVCTGICRQQNTLERKRLPTYYNRYLEGTKVTLQHTLCEQCMLWLSFTLSFYGFLCASEC